MNRYVNKETYIRNISKREERLRRRDIIQGRAYDENPSPSEEDRIFFSQQRNHIARNLASLAETRKELAQAKARFDYDTVIRNAAKRSLGVSPTILGVSIQPQDYDPYESSFTWAPTEHPLLLHELHGGKGELRSLRRFHRQLLQENKRMRENPASNSEVPKFGTGQPFRLP